LLQGNILTLFDQPDFCATVSLCLKQWRKTFREISSNLWKALISYDGRERGEKEDQGRNIGLEASKKNLSKRACLPTEPSLGSFSDAHGGRWGRWNTRV